MKVQRILAVDDSPAIHDLLRVHLQDEYIELRSAYDGESGVRQAAQLQPDLVLLDIDMPGVDGFEACRRMREDLLTMNTPVIFLTGATGTDQKVYGLDLGASDYITKPFEKAELLARLRSALRVKSRMDFLASNRVEDFMGYPLRA
jgi:DNA-binding response OmpR family regulator